ncbi:MAG: hypothetical protein ACFE89_11480 [Candidatus Hodarchaeota archaeon]
MSEVKANSLRLRGRVLVLWILYLSFLAYVLLTAFLVYLRGGTVQVTLLFVDSIANLIALFLVVFYSTLGLYLTWYFLRRAQRTSPEEGYAYGLTSVVIGVSAPYIYALLLSFMGIMRDLLPVLYVGLLYALGIIVGLRIIPPLITHLKSK